MVESRILKGRNNTNQTLGFRRTDFGLFRDMLGEIPQDTVVERREVLESWLIFKDHFLQAQRRFALMSRKSSKGGRRPEWMNRMLLMKLTWKVGTQEVEA